MTIPDDGTASLDISTVNKAAHAIAGELDLGRLLQTLIHLVLESAGADRGIFLQEKDGCLRMVAEGMANSNVVRILDAVPLEHASPLAHSVVQFVRGTSESVVVADTRADARFADDPYIIAVQPRSILCLPVVQQGRREGILYLENNLASDAFTAQRIQVTHLLASGAAVSLENARLYEEMKQEVAQRQRAEERERTLLEINNAIITNLSQESLLRAVGETLQRVIPFDRIGVSVYEAGINAFRLIVMAGPAHSEYFSAGQLIDPADLFGQRLFDPQHPLLLHDLEKEHLSAFARNLATEGFRSFCGVPFIVQGRLIGALGAASKTRGRYTDADAGFLQEVASQLALAFANMRVYEALKEEVAHRQRAEETLRAITEGTAAVIGSNFFRSLVRHLASALQVRYAFIAECTDAAKTYVRTVAFWKGEVLGDNFAYSLPGTPCERVVGGEVCCYPEKMRELFPSDADLVALAAESYLGVPLHDSSGNILGHLAVMDDKPMDAQPRDVSILRIFAARAGAELERKRADEARQRALVEVEQLKNRLHAENVYLQEEIQREHNFEEMVGSSPALLAVLRQVELIAPTDSTVLIFGETGTGKELIARALHNRGARQGRPLVKVNCGAISAGLVESELFGHVKGAFTGALERRVGRFELAHGGTLFLDEVGELPMETQVKLLRVLQEQEFEPVGSSKTVRVDVRIIAATNRDLEEAVHAGRFRADLFYRLHVLPIRVPPLRDRRIDIPQLVMFFLSRFAKKLGKHIDTVPQHVMDALIQYPWPGNIRELQNVIERAVVLSQGSGLALNRELVAPVPTDRARAANNTVARLPLSMDSQPILEGGVEPPGPRVCSNDALTLQEVERRHIVAVLAQSGWVIEGPKGAAKLLNLHPNTLRSRMKKLGVKRVPHDKQVSHDMS